MPEFKYFFLEKSRAGELLPSLFDLFYRNMKDIADLGEYSTERDEWCAEIGRAIQRDPRQLVLIFLGERLVGFFMYYVNGGVFMMEEIQLEPEIQGSGVFRGLYVWLLPQLLADIRQVAAFTNPKNDRSQAILEHFGFKRVENGAKPFLRYEADYPMFAARLLK